MKLEVRCCCDASRVYGTLEVPRELARGDVVQMGEITFKADIVAKMGDVDFLSMLISEELAKKIIDESRPRLALAYDGEDDFEAKLERLERAAKEFGWEFERDRCEF